MYAISAAYGTLLTIDLGTRSVVAAYTIRGLGMPTGIAVKSGDLYVVNSAGVVSVIAKPSGTMD